MTIKRNQGITWSDVMQNNYGVPSITLTSGKGLVVTDNNGKRYLDFLGGIATNVLGHAHPAIVKAVSKQLLLETVEQATVYFNGMVTD